MYKSVIESYSELWHYTTAPGLHGILTSQQLWATNIFYLNDAEEFTGFFDHKLLNCLKAGVLEGLAEASKTVEGLNYINAAGGQAVVASDLANQLFEILRETTLSLQVYVTSFCSHSGENSEDGLLSQWRGYGTDGGYAIVFDTQALNKLFLDEQHRFFYSFGHWGDVDYFDGDASGSAHEEAIEWEATIRRTVARMVLEKNLQLAEAFFEPIICLATRHKHRGFREESEVRISVVTSINDKPIDEAINTGDNRPPKPVYFSLRGGILVPYIALFERPVGEAAKLPIKKIIVGPHPEKLKRKKAIEKLLNQLEIEATVETSAIPYLGR